MQKIFTLIALTSLVFVAMSCGNKDANSDLEVPTEVTELQQSLEQFQGLMQVVENLDGLKEQMKNVSEAETE